MAGDLTGGGTPSSGAGGRAGIAGDLGGTRGTLDTELEGGDTSVYGPAHSGDWLIWPELLGQLHGIYGDALDIAGLRAAVQGAYDDTLAAETLAYLPALVDLPTEVGVQFCHASPVMAYTMPPYEQYYLTVIDGIVVSVVDMSEPLHTEDPVPAEPPPEPEETEPVIEEPRYDALPNPGAIVTESESSSFDNATPADSGTIGIAASDYSQNDYSHSSL